MVGGVRDSCQLYVGRCGLLRGGDFWKRLDFWKLLEGKGNPQMRQVGSGIQAAGHSCLGMTQSYSMPNPRVIHDHKGH